LEENIFAWVYIMRKEANKKKRGLLINRLCFLENGAFGTHGNIAVPVLSRPFGDDSSRTEKVANISHAS
jgi:hypothetical protein